MKNQKLLPVILVLSLLIVCFVGLRYLRPSFEFGELSQLAVQRTDKAMEKHGFTEIYEHFFHPFRGEPTRFFEIGIAEGGSLALWSDYFPEASIFAIDIVDNSSMDSKRVKTFVADQADRDQLDAFIEKFGGDFDVILDDGGHAMDHQQISFGHLMKHVKPGGYYIIEDVHTSLGWRYTDGYALQKDGKNSTLLMITEFLTKGTIKSVYLTSAEEEYLSNNIEYANLFSRKRKEGIMSLTCVFKKKERALDAAR
jgi:hypothetical protein